MHFKIKKILLVFIALSGLSACTAVGVATGVGAVGGIAAAREGGFKQTAIDARIALEINDLWFKYDTDAFLKLNMTVEQGRVLVTGVVQNPDHRVEAIRLAWQPKGVVQVINEVRVANSEGFTGYARDSWITGKLRTRLIFDRDVQSINYTIDTVQSIVYLMGIAQDQVELNKVIALARDTGYVKNVVSYVKIAGEPIDAAVEPISNPVPLNNEYGNTNAPANSANKGYSATPLPSKDANNWQNDSYDNDNVYDDDGADDYQDVYDGGGYGYNTP